MVNMRKSIQEIFNPTPAQLQEKEEQYKKLIQRSYDEKWCCSCANGVAMEVQEHGNSTVLTECQIHEYWKMKNGCKNYKSAMK